MSLSDFLEDNREAIGYLVKPSKSETEKEMKRRKYHSEVFNEVLHSYRKQPLTAVGMAFRFKNPHDCYKAFRQNGMGVDETSLIRIVETETGQEVAKGSFGEFIDFVCMHPEHVPEEVRNHSFGDTGKKENV
jgi:hypothetical protein